MRVVLWGARRGDIQLASREDEGRTFRLNYNARAIRALQDLNRQIAQAMAPSVMRAAEAFRQSSESLAAAASTQIDLDELARRLQRPHGRG